VNYPIDVTASGAVVLGPEVICDGFRSDRKIRVQTHVHDDHMGGFNRSKGYCDAIVCSRETRALLVAEFDADLNHRPDLLGIDLGNNVKLKTSSIELLPSEHILGSAQAAVTTADGLRLGYSGDFGWPLNEVIQVEALVVDSTYGIPQRIRHYTQGDANGAFVKLVAESCRTGPVHVKAYRGTIQRALKLLFGETLTPILVSPVLMRDVNVYRHFGYSIPPLCVTSSHQAHAAMEQKKFIRFYGKSDIIPSRIEGTEIVLSGFMSDPCSPIQCWSPGRYTIAMSDHADFNGTLEYVRATGAKYVVTDNTRAYGVELAFQIQQRLGIAATWSSNSESPQW